MKYVWHSISPLDAYRSDNQLQAGGIVCVFVWALDIQ